MSIKEMLKDLIIKYEYYLILSYILTICGIIINSNIHILNTNFFHALYIITVSTFFLSILAFNLLFKKDEKTKKEYFGLKIYKWNYMRSLKMGTQKKFINYIKVITSVTLFLIPLIIGGWYYAIFISSSASYLKVISTAFGMTLIFTMLIRGEVFQEHNFSIIHAFFIVALMIMAHPLVLNFLDNFLDYILNDISTAFTILIAIIMLCVGLAALSFGYCSILNENSKSRENMKRNGEGYFISSILSMIAILCLFLTSFMKKFVIFGSLSNLNVMSFEFILLNIYSSFVIIIFLFTIYSSYCMLKSSILSLKELQLSK